MTEEELQKIKVGSLVRKHYDSNIYKILSIFGSMAWVEKTSTTMKTAYLLGDWELVKEDLKGKGNEKGN